MTFDSWGHLYLTFAVKRQGRGPFKPIRGQVIEPGDLHYPLLPHWFYSHLPDGFLLRRNQLINPLLETVFVFVALSLALAAGIDRVWVLLGGLCYVVTPLWFSKISIGPRVLNFTTRTFSELIYPLAIALVLFPLPIPDAIAIVGSAILLAAVMLGSKFGVQVVFFVTPLIAAFAVSWALLATLVLAIGLAQLVSRGEFTSQLRHQAAHLTWYASELRAGRLPIQGRNALRSLREWSPEKTRAQNIRRLVFAWLARNSITGVILRAPHFVAIAGLVIAAIVSQETFEGPLVPMIAGAAVVYALTSLKYLLFIGQAERYLSHVSIWSNILFVGLCAIHGVVWLVWCAIAYGIAFSLAELILLRGELNPELRRSANAVMTYLEGLDDKRTILVYPYHAVPPYRIMISTHHTCLLPWMSNDAFKTAMKGLEDYPRVDLTLLDDSPELSTVDTLIVNSDERRERLPQWRAPVGWHRIEGSFGKLDVYERRA